MSVLEISPSDNEDEQLLANEEVIVAVEAPTSMVDERANVPISETSERFLRAILAKVPLDRIEELHLFSPLRQGTIETGIAVVAARVIVIDEPDADEILASTLELELEAGNEVYNENALADNAADHDAPAEESDADAVDNTLHGEALAADATDEPRADEDDSPYSDEEPIANAEELSADTEVVPDVSSESEELAPTAMEEEFGIVVTEAPRVRHTVYTARYRLVVKGPERGRWEIDVVDEADAPLLTVETVVRGVQRRAGEETATVRYDATQIARVLRIPA